MLVAAMSREVDLLHGDRPGSRSMNRPASRPRLTAFTYRLLTSSSSPQPDRSTTAARNSHSVSREAAVGEVRTQVLDQDLPAKDVLHLPHARREQLDGLLRVGQRQQVVEMLAAGVAPAGVLAHQRGLEAVDGTLHARQVLAIKSAPRSPRPSPTPCRLSG